MEFVIFLITIVCFILIYVFLQYREKNLFQNKYERIYACKLDSDGYNEIENERFVTEVPKCDNGENARLVYVEIHVGDNNKSNKVDYINRILVYREKNKDDLREIGYIDKDEQYRIKVTWLEGYKIKAKININRYYDDNRKIISNFSIDIFTSKEKVSSNRYLLPNIDLTR